MTAVAQPPDNPVARVSGPVYLLLFPIPVVCFLATVVTDVTYSQTEQLMWLHFSQWLIAAGLAFGALAAVALLVEFVASRAIRAGTDGWRHLVFFCAALVLGLINSFVHTTDGWTAVVPAGLMLSIVVALLALLAVAMLFRVPVAWVERSPS